MTNKKDFPQMPELPSNRTTLGALRDKGFRYFKPYSNSVKKGDVVYNEVWTENGNGLYWGDINIMDYLVMELEANG